MIRCRFTRNQRNVTQNRLPSVNKLTDKNIKELNLRSKIMKKKSWRKICKSNMVTYTMCPSKIQNPKSSNSTSKKDFSGN